MMKIFILTICLLVSGIVANAQQNYDVSLIPKELLPYASTVIRDKEESVRVNEPDNVTYRIKEARTVINNNGDGVFSFFMIKVVS